MELIKPLKSEHDMYLLLSWIVDSCDLDISLSIQKYGCLKTLEKLQTNFNPKYVKRLKTINSFKDLKEILLKNEIQYISKIDPKWPKKLNDLFEFEPLGLFFKGDFNILEKNCISIVGTRKASSEGITTATEIAFDLARLDFAVISGGAIGIDSSCHHGTLIADGYVVSIQANGLNKFYPSKNADLFRKVLKKGLILSEYPPYRSPTKISFLHRNRLIAALSNATVVIEAQKISGALSTARYASKLGRHLLSVPGSIYSENSAGTNELIKNREAEVVTNSQDILEMVSPIGANI